MRTYFLLPAMVLLVSCFGGSDTKSISSAVLDPTGLIGTWKVCENDNDISYLHQSVFDGTTLTYSFFTYGDVDCVPADLEAKQDIIYSYTVTSGIMLETVVLNSKFTFYKASGGLHYDVAKANTSPTFCGLSWTVNVTQDITNLSCNSSPAGKESSGTFDISNNQLTLGSLIYTKQ